MRHIWKYWLWLTTIILLAMVAAASIITGFNPLERKNVGGLQVITQDTPSSLFLDGQYLDKTPFIQKNIKPGTYTLKIEPDNTALTPYETVVTVRRGLLTVVTWKPGDRPETSGGVMYELEPIGSNITELSFITIPDNALVKVDQAQQQFSPIVVKDLEPGHHQFEVTLPSYETQRHTINVVKGHRITISVKLAKVDDSPPEPVPASPTTMTPESLASPSGTQVATPTARRRTTTETTTADAGQAGPTIIITSTKFFQDGQEVLRIRATPTSGGTELGFAPVGTTYPYLNEEKNGWYKISFNGKVGWASGQYADLKQ